MFVKYLLFLALSDNENVFCKIVKNLTKNRINSLKNPYKNFWRFFGFRLILKSDFTENKKSPVKVGHWVESVELDENC